MVEYSDDQMKLMRLAGISTGYGISELTSSHPSPSVYKEDSPPVVGKVNRDEFIPMGEYDFDNEVSSLVGEVPVSQSDAASVVLSSLAKLQSLITSATPMMTSDEKARVASVLGDMMDATCG